MHINEFAKTTIITYYKNNPILTSKCTKESFQVSLNINFIKYMFMWRSSITSSIYRLLMPLAHKNIHQHKRKKMRRNWVRNLMLTCSNVYTYLSHFLLTFTNTKERIREEIIHLLYFFMHLYLGYTRMHETPSFCSLDIFFENIKMC